MAAKDTVDSLLEDVVAYHDNMAEFVSGVLAELIDHEIDATEAMYHLNKLGCCSYDLRSRGYKLSKEVGAV